MEKARPSKRCDPILARFDRAIRGNDRHTIEDLCGSLRGDGRSADGDVGYEFYQQAIDCGNTDAVGILAAHGVPGFEDGVFYAVSLGNSEMVRTFIDSSTDRKASQRGFIFSSNGNYLPSVTPLMVASAKNDLQITKILLESGHELPAFTDLHARCGSDYERAATLVYWYKALSSESYILLTSDDPFTVTYDHLQRSNDVDISLYPDLLEEMGYIEKCKGLLARNLLEKTQTKEEAASLLDAALLEGQEGPSTKCIRSSNDYIRIIQSPCLQYHEFVGARRFQEYINDIWYQADVSNWRKMSTFCFILVTSFICLITPVLSILYLLWPGRKTKELLKGGYMRFLLHLASDIVFILLLISTVVDVRLMADVIDRDASLLDNIVKSDMSILYKSVHVDTKKMLIVLWIFGMAGRRVQILWRCRNSHARRMWHLWDGLQIFLYLVFVVSLFVANRKARLEGLFHLDGRNDTMNATTPDPSGSISTTSSTYGAPIDISPTSRDYLSGFPPDDVGTSPVQSNRGLLEAFLTANPEDIRLKPGSPPSAEPRPSTNFVGQREAVQDVHGHYVGFIRGDGVLLRFKNQDRYSWSSFDPVFISEAAFAIATIMTFLRLLHLCIFVRFLGPIKISLGGMFVQNIKFLTIFSFVWISFSMGLCQLYRSFEVLEVYECSQQEPGNPDCTDILAFANLYNAMWSLFWSLFDVLDLGLFEVDTERFSSIQALGFFMYGFYMVLSVIILLNALIAMMSNHYTRIEENAEMEWRFARTELMIHFINHMPTVPPPLNLVWPLFRGAHLVIKRVARLGGATNNERKGLHEGDCQCQKVYKETVNKVRARLLQERYIELEEKDRTRRQIDRLEKSVEELRSLVLGTRGNSQKSAYDETTALEGVGISLTEPDGRTTYK